MSTFELLKSEPGEGEEVWRALPITKMEGCNEPIKARSSIFPSWLRRLRILSCALQQMGTPPHAASVLSPRRAGGSSHDPRPNHHRQGEVSMLSIGQYGPPRTTLASRLQRRERGRSVPEHRSPGGSLPCPGLTLPCPGRVRGRLDPTQRFAWGPNLLLSLHFSTIVTVRCAVWALSVSWLVDSQAVPLAAVGVERGDDAWRLGYSQRFEHDLSNVARRRAKRCIPGQSFS